MSHLSLAVEVRDTKASSSALRKQNKIPAVFYGRKEESMSLQVDYQTFRKLYEKAGSNTVVEIEVGGKKKPVLIHDIQYNPLTDRFAHIDFMFVNMNVEIKAMIPVKLVGTSPAVKDLGGVITTLMHEVEVKCLPKDLPQFIEVDLSGLAQIHSSVHVKDLVMAKNVKVLAGDEEVVVTISQQAKEEVAAPVVAEVAATTAAAGAAPAAEGSAAPVKA